MTIDEAAEALLALRGRLTGSDTEVECARALLDRLGAAETLEERSKLVGTLLAVLVDMDELRSAVLPIIRALAPHAAEPFPTLDPSAFEQDFARAPQDEWRRPSGRRRGETLPGGLPQASEQPAMIERTPHLDVDVAQPIPVGAQVTASVYVDTEELREGEGGGSFLLPALDELRLGVMLTVSPHFVIRGKNTGEIVVRAAKPKSSTATFDLDCVGGAEGRAGVAASFTYMWRPVGSVSRELEVKDTVPAGSASLALPAAAVAVDPKARPPHLVVTIKPCPDGDERHFDLTVTSPYMDEFTVPWHLTSRTKDIVDGFMSAFTTTDPGGRKAALLGAGKDLFGSTPPEFQQAFWTLAKRDHPLETIFVVTSEPFIPWELMVPNDGQKVGLPLGVEFSVGRWVHPQLVSPPQALRIVDSYVIAPDYRGDKKLGFAAAEAKFVLDAFNGQRISPAFIRTIDATLGARGATLLHLICHGVDDAGGQVLDLDPDERLREVQLGGLEGIVKAVAERKPLVFINACQVGRQAPALVGTGGFAARFTRLGARCVIAPIWSVKDSVAAEVARTFYERVQAEPGLPFARILRDIRKRAYEGNDPEDSFAAYCFYGDPLAAHASD